MPNIDLVQGMRDVHRYDVIGEYGNPNQQFVTHVGLCGNTIPNVKSGIQATITHMKPPLVLAGSMHVHAAGEVPLTNEERKEIAAFIEETKDEYKEAKVKGLHQFVVDPPWEILRDKNTEITRCRRYSCAGFVLYAHQQIEIKLLDIQKNSLPPVGFSVLTTAYPWISGRRSSLGRYGLKGNGPWQIVLPGYVLHSLARSEKDIRTKSYVAQNGDERYP